MHEPAAAKINLFLHILGKRPDGYHDIESLVAFADCGDVLHAAAADALTLHITGPFASGLSTHDNLVLRAARALQAAVGINNGAALHLEKNLPVASGIGGGSADAAAALRLLPRLWNIAAPQHTLEKIALTLGSDVSACLHSRAAFATGRGEALQFVPLPELYVVLVNPGVQLSTAEVYNRHCEAEGRSNPENQKLDCFATLAMTKLIAHLRTARNDLQAPAIALAPQIQTALDALAAQPGCRLARMSGSGATCFGIFSDAESASCAAEALSKNGDWWVQKSNIKSQMSM